MITSIRNETHEDRFYRYLKLTMLETRWHKGDLIEVFKFVKVLITYLMFRTNTRGLYLN